MKTRPIGVYNLALWGGQDDIDPKSGEIISGYALKFVQNKRDELKLIPKESIAYKHAKILEQVNKDELIPLPNYSMAYVRQKFVEQVEKSKDRMEGFNNRYHLNDAPRFRMERNPEERQKEGKYISDAHCFCEDFGLEEDFWDYFDAVTLPITRAWCDKEHYPYTET